MDRVFDFLHNNRDVSLATVDNGRPKVRIFQIMKFESGNLYFATAEHKQVYKQLLETPYAELVVAADNISIRIDGDVYFDVDDSVAREIYNSNEVLHPIYPDYKSMVYFRLKIATIDYFNLNFIPPQKEHYQL